MNTIKVFEVTFPEPVPAARELTQAIHAVMRMAGPCQLVVNIPAPGHAARIAGIFDQPVDVPSVVQRAVDLLAGAACDAWMRENHTHVMWPAAAGFRPLWSKTDAALLGVAPDPGAPAEGEPRWDESVFQISCSAREDWYGENPANPERGRIRAQRTLERNAIRAGKGLGVSPSREQRP